MAGWHHGLNGHGFGWTPGVAFQVTPGSQGSSRGEAKDSALLSSRDAGEGERVLALESREGTRAPRRVEEGLSRSFTVGGAIPSFPSPSAGDLRELPGVPLRGEGSCGFKCVSSSHQVAKVLEF